MSLDDNTPDDVSKLLRAAGPRPAIPEARGAGVYHAVHAQWRAHLRARRRRRLVWIAGGLAAAAAVALAGLEVAGPLAEALGLSPRPAVAFVERSRGGGVWVSPARRPRSFLPERAPALAGSWLETASDGRAALRLSGRTSLRLDAGTRVRILSASAVWLERGALYVDNPEGPESGPLEIRTPHGVAQDVGTQFEVRAGAGETRIRVREGLVVLARDGVRHEVAAGSELRVDQAGGVARSDIAPYDPAWRWVEQASPQFELEGATLGAFLEWFHRETGLAVEVDPDVHAHVASEVTLHGSLEALTPSEALDVVLPTCGLAHRQRVASVWIESATGDGAAASEGRLR